MVQLRPEPREVGQPPVSGSAPPILVQPSFSVDRTLKSSDPPALNTITSPIVSLGAYFTGEIHNDDPGNYLDVVISVQSKETALVLPPLYAVNLANQPFDFLYLVPDSLNPGASITYRLTGRYLVPFDQAQADLLSASGRIAIVPSSNASTFHKALYQKDGETPGAGGLIGGGTLITMPFDGTAEIDMHVSGATTIQTIVSGGPKGDYFPFTAAGYAHFEQELPNGTPIALYTTNAVTITTTIGAKA